MTFLSSQIAYKRLSGRTLPVLHYRKALALSIIIPILSTTSVVITHLTMVHFKPTQIIPYVFLEVLTYMLGGYWYLLCESLSMSAIMLAQDFQEVGLHAVLRVIEADIYSSMIFVNV